MRWEREAWVKLYRREIGSFALLPLYVRALAAELLKFVDDAGRLYVGNREPWEAIAKLCGATTGDRRLLRQHIPALIADGYLVRDGEYLVVRNLTAAQSRSSRPGSPPPDGEAEVPADERTGASGERTGNESSTNRERTVNEPARVVNELETKTTPSVGNCSRLSLAGARASERIEESRVEESRDPAPRPADVGGQGLLGGMGTEPKPKPPRPPSMADSLKRIRAAYDAGVREGGGRPFASKILNVAPKNDPLFRLTIEHGKDVNGKRLVLDDLDEWVRSTAADFRRAIPDEQARYYANFNPDGCLNWLNTGRQSGDRPTPIPGSGVRGREPSPALQRPARNDEIQWTPAAELEM